MRQTHRTAAAVANASAQSESRAELGPIRRSASPGLVARVQLGVPQQEPRAALGPTCRVPTWSPERSRLPLGLKTRVVPAGLLLSLALLLTACAERSGCPTVDLAEFGRAEGERGEAATLPHALCELDESERDRYQAGRALGLASYCEPQRGFDAGLRGEALPTEVCPLDRRAKFQSAVQTAGFLLEKEAQQQDWLAQARELEAQAESAEESEASALRERAAALRMNARQAENDLEALRGVAIVEGWMPPPAIPDEPQPPVVED